MYEIVGFRFVDMKTEDGKLQGYHCKRHDECCLFYRSRCYPCCWCYPGCHPGHQGVQEVHQVRP